MDKVDAKCFQSMTMEMKINLGLKYSLVSLISNSICLHSTRIYAPFQPDKNLILGNKALQIEFKGKKTQHFPIISRVPQLQTSTKGTVKVVTKSRANVWPLDTVALASTYNKNQYSFPHASVLKIKQWNSLTPTCQRDTTQTNFVKEDF